ncbi:MAG: hypothetical protein AB1540_05965 [Bdellovibrionota bacterium]
MRRIGRIALFFILIVMTALGHGVHAAEGPAPANPTRLSCLNPVASKLLEAAVREGNLSQGDVNRLHEKLASLSPEKRNIDNAIRKFIKKSTKRKTRRKKAPVPKTIAVPVNQLENYANTIAKDSIEVLLIGHHFEVRIGGALYGKVRYGLTKKDFLVDMAFARGFQSFGYVFESSPREIEILKLYFNRQLGHVSDPFNFYLSNCSLTACEALRAAGIANIPPPLSIDPLVASLLLGHFGKPKLKVRYNPDGKSIIPILLKSYGGIVEDNPILATIVASAGVTTALVYIYLNELEEYAFLNQRMENKYEPFEGYRAAQLAQILEKRAQNEAKDALESFIRKEIPRLFNVAPPESLDPEVIPYILAQILLEEADNAAKKGRPFHTRRDLLDHTLDLIKNAQR